MRTFWGAILILNAALAAADPGKTGLGFLTLGNGARATGMGEAHSAVAEGAGAIYWNPAGLGLTPFHELSLTHLEHFEDSSQQHAALAIPVKKGKKGGFGIAVTRFAIENIEGRDAQGAKIGDVEEEDLNIQVSYGTRLLQARGGSGREGLYGGVGVKRISQKLAGLSEDTFGYDLGFQYRPGNFWEEKLGTWTRRTTLGLSALHIGKGITFDQQEAELPQTTRLGLAYTHFLWGDALNLAFDFVLPKAQDPKTSVGAEFWVKNTVALRLGFIQGQDVGDEVRAGAGFRFQTLQLDYAWAGFGDELGNTHRVTLGVRFGEGVVAEKTGLKSDLVKYHLSQAQDALASGSFHEAVMEANKVLEADPRNPMALQILVEAGEKMKPADPLPEPLGQESADEQEEAAPGDRP